MLRLPSIEGLISNNTNIIKKMLIVDKGYIIWYNSS